MDGTRAESKLPIDDEMASLLGEIIDSGAQIGVVSGAGYGQFAKQVTNQLLKHWMDTHDQRCGSIILLPLNGSETYLFEGDNPGQWNRVSTSDLNEEEKTRIFDAFKLALEQAEWSPHNPTYGELIEDRGAQVTFSALGQKAPLDLKATYDPDQRIRMRIKSFLDDLLPDFDVRVGGTTSIDVNRKGFDKARAVEKVMETKPELSLDSYLFVGDALYEGGNDETVKRLGIPWIQVSGPSETKQVIRKILDASE